MKKYAHYFKDGKWSTAGLLKVIKKLFENHTKLPSIFYGNTLFEFYARPDSDLEHWKGECDAIIKERFTGNLTNF